MIEPDFWRQLDVFAPDRFQKSVHVIGVGATGSWITLVLAKMGVQDITVYDFDKVEAHNLPNQIYGPNDVGKPKAEALEELVWLATGTKIKPQVCKVDGAIQLSGVVFLCVDTMEDRQEIWQGAIKFKLAVDLMIETRMAAEGGLIYTIRPMNPTDIREWEKTLYSSEEAEESACTNRAIATNVAFMAGIAVHKVVKFYRGDKYNKEVIVSLKPLHFMGRSW